MALTRSFGGWQTLLMNYAGDLLDMSNGAFYCGAGFTG